ncbi:MAG: hypothetical protein IT229_02020 [Flavobacteriales bacterium]|nr:hypothetical protein [Flavobacteriales bacterium]
MDNTFFARIAAIVALTLAMVTGLKAQTATTPSIAYQVSGLSPDMRDQLAQALQQQGTMRIAFACVPAGILVFEPVNGGLRADLQQQVESLIAQHVGRSSITLSSLDRNQLEAQCAGVRNL